MNKLYTVGEISKIFNITIDSLRYYDQLDLIKPWKIGENGYRYYEQSQFDMISTVLFLRSAGTPLKTIKEILHQEDTEEIEKVLGQHQENIQKKIQELRYVKLRIEMLNRHMAKAHALDVISTEEIDGLWILAREFSDDANIHVDEAQKINQSIAEEWVSFANVMSTISKEDLLARNYHKYRTYGFVSEFPYKEEDEHISIVRHKHWVSVVTKVSRLDHKDIDVTYDKILDYLDRHNLEIVGETIERSLLDLYGKGGTNEDTKIHYYKIYVPVGEIKHLHT